MFSLISIMTENQKAMSEAYLLEHFSHPNLTASVVYDFELNGGTMDSVILFEYNIEFESVLVLEDAVYYVSKADLEKFTNEQEYTIQFMTDYYAWYQTTYSE